MLNLVVCKGTARLLKVKMHLHKVGFKGMDKIKMVQDRDMWQAGNLYEFTISYSIIQLS
jgi:hypothetical protein